MDFFQNLAIFVSNQISELSFFEKVVLFVLNFLFEISCEPGEYSNRNSEDVLVIKILIVVVTVCISS